MLETTFTTKLKHGPIPADFPVYLEGNYIAVIGPNNSGKTFFLYTLFLRNVNKKFEGKTQVCLIHPTRNIHTTASTDIRTLEQYNIELAKIMGEIQGGSQRGNGPSPDDLPKLLLTHYDFAAQVQQLNSYLEYLGLPQCDIQGTQEVVLERMRSIFHGSALHTILAILTALTDDYIKMVLIAEPEVDLHPRLQNLLRDLLYDASKKKQIIITTHSNLFLNKADYKSNYVISNDKNTFSITRVSSEDQINIISSAEIDFVEALAKAVPSFKPNLLNSLGVKESDVEKTEKSNKFTEVIQEKIEETNLIIFYKELLVSIKRTKEELATRRIERVLQTNITYYVSLVCLIFSVLLVFVGVILIFVNKLEGGVLTTVSSVISSIVSGLAFGFNKQANDLEREESKEMKTLEKSYDAMGYISLITNDEKRDELIGILIEKIMDRYA